MPLVAQETYSVKSRYVGRAGHSAAGVALFRSADVFRKGQLNQPRQSRDELASLSRHHLIEASHLP